MNVFQFMSDSPILSFFLAYIIFNFTLTLCNRLIRGVVVLNRGWPPSHLDADGDWKDEDCCK